MNDPRLPDFIVIGAAKSGTTSLFRWLGEHEGVWLPPTKEPNFFSQDEVWRRGIDWYAALFAPAPRGSLAGEASPNYTGPRWAAAAATRMAQTVPSARLVYLVRDPVERLRSHWRHDVQRGRERRPLAEAAADPGSPYVGFSCYFSRLRPYLDAFPRDRICVVRFEDLVGGDGSGWRQVLAHLGLPARPRPETAYNVTAEKPRYNAAVLRLWEWGLLGRLKRLPKPVRRAARRLLAQRAEAFAGQGEAEGHVPPHVARLLAEEAELLRRWLGRDRPLWPLRA